MIEIDIAYFTASTNILEKIKDNLGVRLGCLAHSVAVTSHMAPVWAPLALVETFIPVEVPVAYTKTASCEWAVIRVTGTDIGNGSSEVLNGTEDGS